MHDPDHSSRRTFSWPVISRQSPTVKLFHSQLHSTQESCNTVDNAYSVAEPRGSIKAWPFGPTQDNSASISLKLAKVLSGLHQSPNIFSVSAHFLAQVLIPNLFDPNWLSLYRRHCKRERRGLNKRRRLSDSQSCMGRNRPIKLLICKYMLSLMKMDDSKERASSQRLELRTAENYSGLET